MKGKHIGEPEITLTPVTHVSVRAEEPVPSHLDGEVQAEQTEFEIEVLPGALRLL